MPSCDIPRQQHRASFIKGYRISDLEILNCLRTLASLGAIPHKESIITGFIILAEYVAYLMCGGFAAIQKEELQNLKGCWYKCLVSDFLLVWLIKICFIF